jgi:hypothetical protein
MVIIYRLSNHKKNILPVTWFIISYPRFKLPLLLAAHAVTFHLPKSWAPCTVCMSSLFLNPKLMSQFPSILKVIFYSPIDDSTNRICLLHTFSSQYKVIFSWWLKRILKKPFSCLLIILAWLYNLGFDYYFSFLNI